MMCIRFAGLIIAAVLLAAIPTLAEDGVVRPEAIKKAPAVRPAVRPDAVKKQMTPDTVREVDRRAVDKAKPGANAAMKIRPQQARKISPADKQALIAAFKDVDPSKYRLQFDNGKEVYGEAAIQMTDVQQVDKITAPGSDKGWIVLVVEGDDVIYVLAVGNLDSVIGADRAAKLRGIQAKYQAPQQMEAPHQQQMEMPGVQQGR
jgi:hypothetical protein